MTFKLLMALGGAAMIWWSLTEFGIIGPNKMSYNIRRLPTETPPPVPTHN